MAFVIADRVRETTTTIGTGSVTLGGAYISFQTFSAAIGNGNNTYYTIASAATGEWEVGIGTYSSGPNSLSRDTVLASSAGGAKVSFSVGSKDVFVTQPAERSLLLQSGGSGLFAGNAAFTANGLLYANATTTATTSSALTFDGTTLTASASASASGNFKTTSTSAQVYNLTASNDANTTIGLGVFGSAAGTFGTLGAGTPFLSTSAATMVQNVQNASGVFVWGIGATPAEQMRLTSTGLGIGTNSPAYKLDVVGTAAISGGVTLSGGTANGVAYLNGSKVLTTGSALTFDGSTFGVATTAGNMALFNSTAANGGYLTIQRSGVSKGYIGSAAQLSGGSNDDFTVRAEANLVFSLIASEQMRLTSTGLGIGTSSPGAKLDVNGGTNSEMRLTTSGSGYLQVGQFTNGAFIGTSSSDATAGQLRLGTGGASQVWLSTTGNLGIGTSSPSWRLVVNAASGGGMQFENSSDSNRGGRIIATGSAASGTFAVNTTSSGYALTFGIDGTERMRLDTSGNLGIGTSSPGYKLDVVGTGAFNGLRIGANGSDINSTFAGASSILSFQINSSEKARIDSSGNLGIGTTSPATKLHVNTGAAGYGITVAANSQTSITYQLGIDSNSNLAFYDTNAAAQRLVLSTSGNLGLGVTPSAWSGQNAIQFNYGAFSAGTAIGTLMATNSFYNGTNWIYRISSTAMRYTQDSAGHYWHTAPSGTAGNAITFTQAMTLDASGNLGLGVTPSAWTLSGVSALQIKNAGYWGYLNRAYMSANMFIDSGGSTKYIASDYATYYAQINGGHAWLIAPSGTAGNAISFTQAMTLDASGNLLVGTTDSSPTSGVGTKIRANGLAITCVRSETVNTSSTYEVYSTGAAAYRFYVGMGGTVFATNTTISAISDQRLKENVRDLDDGLSAIMALKPRKFDWKAGKGKDIKDDRGFVAQEFEQVFPDMIDEWKDPAPEGEEPYKSVRADLIPVLVKAIQELKAEVDSLKAQLKGA